MLYFFKFIVEACGYDSQISKSSVQNKFKHRMKSRPENRDGFRGGLDCWADSPPPDDVVVVAMDSFTRKLKFSRAIRMNPHVLHSPACPTDDLITVEEVSRNVEGCNHLFDSVEISSKDADVADFTLAPHTIRIFGDVCCLKS